MSFDASNPTFNVMAPMLVPAGILEKVTGMATDEGLEPLTKPMFAFTVAGAGETDPLVYPTPTGLPFENWHPLAKLTFAVPIPLYMKRKTRNWPLMAGAATLV